jgi:hypothetical protein
MIRGRILMLAATAIAIVGISVSSHAQSPGGTNMKFVPVDTNKNLAAPVPTVYTPPPKPERKPILARIGDAIGRLNPFKPKQPASTAGTIPQPNGNVQPASNFSPAPSLPQGLPTAAPGAGR